ncbi:hypothetical protein [Paenibacillus polysaccharolyticus]|uniref:hypothetical protein n=1 Tax=Paenibacillus polysaccharolyticus TaxID=582692 RepID=UPI0012B6DF15|nr:MULTISPECIES: hypothetical protein [Paenibacillus]
MKHEDDQWEKEIRKGPFAMSPFTEDHKRKVLQQVQRIRTVSRKEEEMSEMSPLESSLERSGSHFDLSRRYTDPDTNAVNDRAKAKDISKDTFKVGPILQRHRKSRRGILVAGLSALVIAGGIFMWNWDEGQLAKPLIEQINPASALLFTDHLNIDILTEQMKKNVAMTMRDDLGKQLRITKVQDLPVSGRIYVEAGQEKGTDYAQIWLDAKTGNLREVQMRAEMQPSKLEHRYMRQVSSLLESIGSAPTLKPILVRRFVNMNQGEILPIIRTTLALQNETSFGYIEWEQDKVTSVSGEINSDEVSQTALADAKESVAALSGKTNLNLESIHRTKDNKLGGEFFFFQFSQNYFVEMTEGKEGVGYTVRDVNNYESFIGDSKEMEAYHEKLYNMDETIIREKVGPIIKSIFNINLDAYKLHRKADALGMVTFELESANDIFEVEYKEDGRITMISRGKS